MIDSNFEGYKLRPWNWEAAREDASPDFHQGRSKKKLQWRTVKRHIQGFPKELSFSQPDLLSDDKKGKIIKNID